MWTTVCLILAKITERYMFDGASIIWLVGLPLILIIIATREDERINVLLIDTNTYEVLNQPLE